MYDTVRVGLAVIFGLLMLEHAVRFVWQVFYRHEPLRSLLASPIAQFFLLGAAMVLTLRRPTAPNDLALSTVGLGLTGSWFLLRGLALMVQARSLFERKGDVVHAHVVTALIGLLMFLAMWSLRRGDGT